MPPDALVLVVDNDQPSLRLQGFTLQTCGYRVLTAVRPNEAIQLLNSNRPNLIVFDYRMPRMDGEEFYTRVLNKGYRGEFLMFSAWSGGAQVAERLGVSFLEKPFEPDVLCAEVERLLNKTTGSAKSV
jgi:CheY-like chemotaxis protein